MKSETIKVLLIEDDEDDYILTRELLSEMRGGKYHLNWASSYEQGLKVAGHGEHQVCLVDYRLGERSGVDLIREARKLGFTTPMILLTGQGNHDVDMEAIEAGATDYLVKDETPALRLERTIRYAVQLNTERKQAELVRLQGAALESADNAILITSNDGTITWVNSAFTALTGYTSAEAIGQNPRILKSGQHDAAFYKSMWETLNSGKVWHGELVNLRKDGTTFDEEQTITPVLTETGQITNFIAIKKDITARKLIAVELEHARDLALESVRLKSEFLANMSHEIRTPMNGVVGMTDLLLETQLTPEQRKMAQTVKECGDSLLSIISDILDFSKIEAGKLAVEMSDLDVRYTIESVIELLLEQAHNKGIKLSARVHTDVLPSLRGDAGRLRQVLTNLIGNAIKFTEAGEVFIEVRQAPNPDADTILRFTIKDTGMGIPSEVGSRLFQPFVQADGSTTRKYGGTGLGLAISRQLVELMGGEIGFVSEAGQGSTFWFTVRMQQQLNGHSVTLDTSALEMPPTQHDAQTKSKVRILLVEDYVINQAVAVGKLENLGYRADVVDDGFAAVKAWELNRYDVVLMDCQMPNLDGYAASAEIRRQEAAGPDNRRIPIIAMTANAMKGDREKCIAAGMDDYITKPIQAEDLKRVMEQWSPPGSAPGSLRPAIQVEPNSFASVHETFPPVDKQRLLDAVGNAGQIPPQFVEFYRSQMSEELNRLRMAIRSESAEEVIQVAHGCAGMNANCGMLAVVEPLRELERMGRRGNLADAEVIADQVTLGFDRIELFLTTMLDTERQLVN